MSRKQVEVKVKWKDDNGIWRYGSRVALNRGESIIRPFGHHNRNEFVALRRSQFTILEHVSDRVEVTK
jgi:hypothetical protein